MNTSIIRLTVVSLFDLIEGNKVWMRLLHLILMTLIGTWPVLLVLWKVLRTEYVSAWLVCHDNTISLRIIIENAQLTYLLDLRLTRKLNLIIGCLLVHGMANLSLSNHFTALPHKVIPRNSKVYQTLFVFIWFVWSRHIFPKFTYGSIIFLLCSLFRGL